MLPLQLIRNEPERVREGARLKHSADAPIDALLEVVKRRCARTDGS